MIWTDHCWGTPFASFSCPWPPGPAKVSYQREFYLVAAFVLTAIRRHQHFCLLQPSHSAKGHYSSGLAYGCRKHFLHPPSAQCTLVFWSHYNHSKEVRGSTVCRVAGIQSIFGIPGIFFNLLCLPGCRQFINGYTNRCTIYCVLLRGSSQVVQWYMHRLIDDSPGSVRVWHL